MGDADYLISNLRGTAESSEGTGAVVVEKSNINACNDALRYPSLGVDVGRILAQALVVFCGMSIALRGGDGLLENILFALFVFWVITCYTTMCWLAWKRPSAKERARRCEQPKRAAARTTRGADEPMENMARQGCKHAGWGPMLILMAQ